MTDDPVYCQPSGAGWPAGRSLLTGVAVLLLTLACLFGLSGRLGVQPGTPVVTRVDTLFSSDLALRAYNLSGAMDTTAELREHYFSLPHPAMNLFWGKPGRLILRLLPDRVPRRARPFVAARLLVAALAALGFAVLHSSASGLPLPGLRGVMILFVALGATANLIVCLPDHWGISYGLLASSFTVWAHASRARRPGLLAVLGMLCAGTTLTNGLFPLALWLSSVSSRARIQRATRTWRKSRSTRLVMVALCVIAVLGGVQAARSLGDRPLVRRHLTLRMLKGPSEALSLALAGATYPVVGPTPRLHVTLGTRQLTYEPVDFHGYGPLQAMGALSWLALLLLSGRLALRDPHTRAPALVAIFWVAWSVLLHGFWGDEFFLFSPHWSWALIAIVLLGAHSLRARLFIPLGLLVLIGQCVTLWRVSGLIGAL